MAVVSVNVKMKSMIEAALGDPAEYLSPSDKVVMGESLASGYLNASDLLLFMRILDHQNASLNKHKTLLECIKGSKAALDSPSKAPMSENVEMQKRRAHLQVRADTREYNRMVFGSEM